MYRLTLYGRSRQEANEANLLIYYLLSSPKVILACAICSSDTNLLVDRPLLGLRVELLLVPLKLVLAVYSWYVSLHASSSSSSLGGALLPP